MRRSSIIIIFIAILIAGCGLTRNTVRTVHISEATSETPAGVVYALPQTVLKISADVLEVKTYRGPYYRYAEKYLGITDVPHENKTEWNLTKVTIESISEADPEEYFIVYAEKRSFNYDRILQLSKEGLLMDLSNLSAPGVSSKIEDQRYHEPGVLFTDLSVKRNIELSSDTLYKTILTDTSFIRVPVLKNELLSKTIDEKAEEAANFIIKTRKRRFKLLAGQYDFYPTGPALEFGVNRLDELEKEYLSLFIGKTIQIPHTIQFYYIPKTDEVYENIELFEYSSLNGIRSENFTSGTVVNLLIKKGDKTKLLDEYVSIELNNNLNRIYYRIPDIAEVEIQDGGKTILKERIPVSQYGTVLSMPVLK
jgi:hypothetical protein